MRINFLGAQANRGLVDIVDFNLNYATDIPNGQSVDITLTPPTGYAYMLTDLYFYCDAVPASTMGKHEMRAHVSGSFHDNEALEGEATFNQALSYSERQWENADLKKVPPAGQDQGSLLGLLIGTATSPIKITYGNLTDATQTNTLFVTASVAKFKI